MRETIVITAPIPHGEKAVAVVLGRLLRQSTIYFICALFGVLLVVVVALIGGAFRIEATSEPDPAPAAAAGVGIGFMIVWFALVLLTIASMWRIFVKAGRPGWAAIVPVYNIIVLLEIAGKPVWWVVLLFIPVVNFVVLLLVFISLARSFGKHVGFGVGMTLLAPVFLAILAFSDDARYEPTRQVVW